MRKPKFSDGVSFAPTLIGQPRKQKQHDYLYWEFHERGGRLAIREGNWKAIRYNVLREPNRRLELYDLSSDLSESNDLAELYPAKVAHFEALFASARTESEIFTFAQRQYQGNVKSE